MADLNQLISTDTTKLYNEKPCEDFQSLLSYNIKEWLNERPPELLIHLQQICNLDNSPKIRFSFSQND